ncbi:PAQR family membrane homeostasis protein TrhA [Asticcacaulis benevestitus]|uniref:Hemolysin III n=1 Tax=Asticcacaulis benevestitus DSM 16100 = ATCC BAA-896 TaxID=1121022 RepID=V4PM72_9CAUL|nr:hemolysin III family protein [Asticcacaulis benevestitus]ESQ88389.1 hemolysin III [Asticcacaulis benevestitus DSM 16100 = ATCC BAA-896]
MTFEQISDKLQHYPTRWARHADLIVHIVGLAFALFGGGVALGLAVSHGLLGKVAAITIYALGMIAMLAFSTAYNFAVPRWQPLLRRLDHAGIFLMIAASYTPFTTQALKGGWALWMSVGVWSLAVMGILAKLFLPGLGKGFWIVLYLILGWLVVIAIKPMVQEVPLPAMILLALGGVVYSVGTIFYAMKNLKFRRAIWHGHVLTGAVLHYVAILTGVILVGGH